MSRKRKQRKQAASVVDDVVADDAPSADEAVVAEAAVEDEVVAVEAEPAEEVVAAAVEAADATDADAVVAEALPADDTIAVAADDAIGVEAADATDADAVVAEALPADDTIAVAADDAMVAEEGDGADVDVAELGATLPTSGTAMDAGQLKRLVEALVFASDKPLTVLRLRQLTRVSDTKRLEQALAELTEDYRERGLVLQQVSGGYQFRTHSQFSVWVQQLIAGRPVRLSRAQLETLAIIAYRQPITRPEIDEIRGVDSSATLKLLIDRSLIRILGKREEVGRPMLYGTTKEFLDFFSLGDLRELPTLREYSELTDESRQVMSDRLGIRLDETAATAAEGASTPDETSAAPASAVSDEEAATVAAEQQAEAESVAVSASDAVAVAEPAAAAESAAESDAVAESDAESVAESDAVSVAESDAVSESVSEPELEPMLVAESDLLVESEPQAQAEAELEPVFVAESEAAIESEELILVAESDPAAESEVSDPPAESEVVAVVDPDPDPEPSATTDEGWSLDANDDAVSEAHGDADWPEGSGRVADPTLSGVTLPRSSESDSDDLTTDPPSFAADDQVDQATVETEPE